jgi:N-acetylglutamate synthase-like GNAT family acetyltransferase
LLERFDRSHHDTDEVKDLLAMAVGYPNPERLKNLLDIIYDIQYLKLYVNTEQGKITGVIGIDDSASPHGWILHLAVHPDYRLKGAGRKIIFQLMETLSLVSVGLETDHEGAGFYRACGFSAAEIHSKWPGVQRYRCIYGNMPASVLEYYDRKELKF